jgi:hypothetical protein
MSRLCYTDITIDYSPLEVARVIYSCEIAQGSGNEDDYFPDIEIPIGHYASAWAAIEAYLDLKWSTGRHATVREIYAIDRANAAKAMARGRRDAIIAILTSKGITWEQYLGLSRGQREILGIPSLRNVKAKVKVDRRKKANKPEAVLNTLVREQEKSKRDELLAEADRILRAHRYEFSSDTSEVLDYSLADT